MLASAIFFESFCLKSSLLLVCLFGDLNNKTNILVMNDCQSKSVSEIQNIHTKKCTNTHTIPIHSIILHNDENNTSSILIYPNKRTNEQTIGEYKTYNSYIKT